MTRYIEDIKNVEISNDSCVITIGFFDGVHLGHVSLIETVLKKNEDKKVKIITFDVHPSKYNLITLEEKLKKLEKYNSEIIIIRMNENNKCTSIEEFIIFLKNIGCNTIYLGQDFRFGYKAKGKISDLQKEFNVEIVEFKKDEDTKISSSIIRNELAEANIVKANKLLGYNYQVKGLVIHGDQIGRTINFPTANIKTKNLLPKNGIYVTKSIINGKIYKSITNVGFRPTLDGKELRVETHILDFDQDIYGYELTVEFIDLIRFEKKFNNLNELKEQIKKDIEILRRKYGN